MIQNKLCVTLDLLKSKYTPEIWNTVDRISNLSNQELGLYAYLLQESFYGSPNVLDNTLVDNKLEKIKLEMLDISISYSKVFPTSDSLLNFELFFFVVYKGIKYPIVIRNGFLLKCIIESGVDSFENLINYDAVLIRNNSNVNPEFCSFVKFIKK